jgi:NAD(P)-dependent dehydrogenase (short-subunit alcohol dehydrogenase family)
MATVLITGANRGLGLEFARQYAAAGWTVLGTCRRPETAGALRATGAQVLTLDVTRPSDADRLVSALPDGRLDLLACNAGILGPRTTGLAGCTDTEFDEIMRTNVRGPWRLIVALADALAAAGGKVALLSSRMGSIATVADTNRVAYRVSKSALNMVGRLAALELGPRGVTVLVLHPGWVRTDMGGPDAPLAPEESIAGMRRVIADARPDERWRHRLWSGEDWPW